MTPVQLQIAEKAKKDVPYIDITRSPYFVSVTKGGITFSFQGDDLLALEKELAAIKENFGLLNFSEQIAAYLNLYH